MTKTISHILLAVFSACALFACTIREQLITVQDEIDDLRVQIGEMNKSIAALQDILTEIWNGGLLSDVETLMEDGEEVGYKLSFFDGRSIVIRQGLDGHSPRIGVALDDNSVWCWTLDGQWLLDGFGKRIPATGENGQDGTDGITPQLKIEDGYWFISMDEGKTWTQLGRAQGKDAVTVFTGIDLSNDAYVEVFLAAGGSIRIPRYIPLNLSIGIPEDETGLSPGETRSFNYELSGRVTDNTVVTAGTDGKYSLSVQKISNTKGVINVTCPQSFSEGFVYILVNDGEGHSVVRVINFYERKIVINTDFSFWVDCYGGTITIPMRYNFGFTLESSSNWLHPVQTKAAMKDGEITISVDANQTNRVRTGKIYVHPLDHPEFTVETFTIEEASAYFNISQSSFTVEAEGGDYYVDIQSSRGASIRHSSNWMSCSLQDNGNYHWTLKMNIARNLDSSSRSTEIKVMTGDGNTQLGTISVTQLGYSVDHDKDFILKVRAAAVYDYTVYLPLNNYVNCVVDWGDGKMESFNGYYYSGNVNQCVSHQYDITEPTTFTVTVSGRVEGIQAGNMTAAETILSVEQWGNLNVNSVSFSGCIRLASVPEDKRGFFSNVGYLGDLFYNCKALSSIPEGLFAYAENVYSLNGIFRNTGITAVPADMLGNMKALTDVSGLFEEMTGLESIPARFFSNCPNVAKIEIFNGVFNGSGLKSIPAGLLKDCIGAKSFQYAFAGTPVTKIPENLFTNCKEVTDFYRVFAGTQIKTIPAKLFAGNKLVRSFNCAFQYCSNMESIPVSIFDENRRVTDFSGVFSWDYPNLQRQESPYTVVNGKKVHLYERENYPDDFVEPTSTSSALSAFANYNWGLENIPSAWR